MSTTATEPPDNDPPAITAGTLPHHPAIGERSWPRPWMQNFLEALSRVPVISDACRYAMISRSTARDARARDPEFAAAWDEAYWVGVDAVDRMVHRWGTTGVPRRVTTTRTLRVNGVVVQEQVTVVEETEVSERMAALWLRAHWPERYGDNRQVRLVDGDGEGGADVEVFRHTDRARARELAAAMRELDAATVDGDAVDDDVEDAEVVSGVEFDPIDDDSV